MSPEQRLQAWTRFMAGALASGKTAHDAAVEADKSAEELKIREELAAQAETLAAQSQGQHP